jgi:hypothetical protein
MMGRVLEDAGVADAGVVQSSAYEDRKSVV